MSSTFQWDCSVAARPPEGTVSQPRPLLALPPASPPAGRGRPAGPRPSVPSAGPGACISLARSCRTLPPTGAAVPRHCSVPVLGSPPTPSFSSPSTPGPRHVDCAFRCPPLAPGIESSRPSLTSPDFSIFLHVAPVLFLEIGNLGSWPMASIPASPCHPQDPIF